MYCSVKLFTLSSLPGKFKCSALEWFSCPEGITPNSGLTGPNNTVCKNVCMYVCMSFTCRQKKKIVSWFQESDFFLLSLCKRKFHSTR